MKEVRKKKECLLCNPTYMKFQKTQINIYYQKAEEMEEKDYKSTQENFL